MYQLLCADSVSLSVQAQPLYKHYRLVENTIALSSDSSLWPVLGM